MTRAVYAGLFDPFTNGHLSIIRKASIVFDEVYVVIAMNSNKQRKYSVNKMMEAVEVSLKENGLDNCKVVLCDKLVADFCKDIGAEHIVRGLRNNIDYNYEENIAEINKVVNPDLETIYFRADEKAISSSMVRELYKFGKNVDEYVPKSVKEIIVS